MRGNRYFVFQKLAVKAKPYSSQYNLNFWLVKTILFQFFEILLPPKVTFPSSEHIFQRILHSVQWKLCLVETVCFVQSFLFYCWKPLLKLGRTILKEKHYPASENHSFLGFLPGEANFLYCGNLFFNECFISGNGNRFFGQYKPFSYTDIPASNSFFFSSS